MNRIHSFRWFQEESYKIYRS